jgi:hypothetical protein
MSSSAHSSRYLENNSVMDKHDDGEDVSLRSVTSVGSLCVSFEGHFRWKGVLERSSFQQLHSLRAALNETAQGQLLIE